MACVVLGATACASTYFGAVIPRKGGPWVVPIVDPLTGTELRVEVEFSANVNGIRRSKQAWLEIDTGAHRSHVPFSLAADLKRPTSEGSRYSHYGVSGKSREWVGVVFPEVRIGTLTLHDAPFGLHADPDAHRGHLGDEYLAQQSLEVDLDLGIVTLGAPPWRGQPGLVEVDYAPSIKPGAGRIELSLDGHEVLMDLDTGTRASIDVDEGNKIGLTLVPYGEMKERRGSFGSFKVSGHFIAKTIRLGDAEVHDVKISALPGYRKGGLFNRKSVGLMGMGFLEHFKFRIDPEDRVLQLLPHVDVVQTAARRIARWDWVPKCQEELGCIRTTVDRSPTGVRVTLSTSKPYPKPARFLVGFVDSNGRLLRRLDLIEVVVRSFQPGDAPGYAFTLCTGDPVLAEAMAGPGSVVRAIVLDVNPVEPWRKYDEGWEVKTWNLRRLRRPFVSEPQAPRKGSGLNKAVLKCGIIAHLDEVRACYEDTLQTDPEACGRLEARFVIDPTGHVRKVTIDAGALPTTMSRCMKKLIKRWVFPKPRGGGIVIVTYPFVLKSQGRCDSASPPP